MKYYLTTLTTATTVSTAEAIARGCDGLTSMWWGIMPHATDSGLAALVFSDEEASTPGETLFDGAVTITTDDLIDALPLGWVAVDEMPT